MKQRLAVALMMLFALGTAQAAADGAKTQQDAASAKKAGEVVAPDVLAQRTGDELIRRIKAQKDEFKADTSKLYAMVDEVVLPHFDFAYMARLVLARNWRKADDSQKERFVKAFRALLVRTYSTALLEYSDEKIEWQPMKAGADPEDVTVKSVITASGAPPVPIDYSMHFRNGRWLVYDIAVENISLVTNYRSTYNSEIRRNGLDALIESMESKAAS